jgi:cytochrome c-type biogenesis protein CcsB
MEMIFVSAVFFYLLGSASYFSFLFFQKEILHRLGFYLVLTGFICHSVTIGFLYAASGYLPVNNLHQTLSIAGWALVAVFFFLYFRYQLKVVGIYAAPLAAFILLAAHQFPKTPILAEGLFKSTWLVIHILTIFFGDAAFTLACGVGILYLIQERTIKTKAPGFFFKRLPSLDHLDTTGYACIVVGFCMLTIGLITGSVYAKAVWGRFWSWDPKEVWSAITWLFYAALIHERLTVGWRGRRAAIMAIIGFAVMLFTFFGVNFLLKGHHGQFTQF